MRLVLFHRCRFKVFNEFFPAFIDFFEDFGENGYCDVLVHFLMEDAEVLTVLGGLPAFLVVAVDLLADLLLVLSKVESLCREHLGANTDLEILVGDQSIAIEVKL